MNKDGWWNSLFSADVCFQEFYVWAVTLTTRNGIRLRKKNSSKTIFQFFAAKCYQPLKVDKYLHEYKLTLNLFAIGSPTECSIKWSELGWITTKGNKQYAITQNGHYVKRSLKMQAYGKVVPIYHHIFCREFTRLAESQWEISSTIARPPTICPTFLPYTTADKSPRGTKTFNSLLYLFSYMKFTGPT